MNKEIIKEKYDKLVSEIEGMKMYDGRGAVDRYVCDTCGYMTHTTYKDKGVTPFTMRCPKCEPRHAHKHYRPQARRLPLQHRPSPWHHQPPMHCRRG